MEKKTIVKYSPTLNSLIQYAIETTEENKIKINKKEHAISIIKNIVDAMSPSKHKIFLEECLANNTISDTIDLVIDASKGKINVNKKINVILRYLLVCFKF